MKSLLNRLKKADLQYVVIFLLLGIAIFSVSFTYEFIWLDKVYVLYNSNLVPLDLHKLFTVNDFAAGGTYRPMTGIYYSSLLNLFGGNPAPFKIAQFLLHFLNTTLLFIFLKKFMRKNLAFILALIFLIHPMNMVDTVFVSAAASTLYFFFGISALLVSQNEKIPWMIRSVIVFILLLACCFAKEEGILFAFMVILYIFLYKRRSIIITAVPAILAVAIYLYFRINIAGIVYSKVELVPIMRLHLVERLINIPVIFMYYIGTFLFPSQLATNQQWIITSPTFMNFFLPLLIIGGLIGAWSFVVYRIKLKKTTKLPDFLFFTAWFTLGIGMYFQIIPLDYTVSNRWFYFPIAGLLGMIGVLVDSLQIHWKHKYTELIVTILILILSIRTFIRTTDWKDEGTLFKHDAEIRTNFAIEDTLGRDFYAKNDYKNALIHFQNSVRLFPYDWNLLHLAQLYEEIGDIENAKKTYLQAAKSDNYGPGEHDRSIYRLIIRFMILYDPTNARDLIKIALKEYPDSYRLWSLYALNEYRIGNRNEALIMAISTMQKYPNNLTTNIVSDIVNKRTISIDDELIF